MSGRFAPSPTGDLHLGNLRTALLAWVDARSHGVDFIVRMEDLDRVTSSVEHEETQLRSLAALGLDWDGPVVRQSDRFDSYRAAVEELRRRDLVYPCFCTRREIRIEIESASRAPNSPLPDGAYPGTCRELAAARVAELEHAGRVPALRLRGSDELVDFDDGIAGRFVGAVDDVVLVRSDGVPAYNLAVVVDDAAQGVTRVVRGDDLLTSTPRQILLQRLLSLPTPSHLHVPLVLGDDGRRLAKRHGAVTPSDLERAGWSRTEVLAVLARSLGLAGPSEQPHLEDLVARYDPGRLPRSAVRWSDLRAFRRG
ncbi:MAG: tRNA glutamyl-Q(34) synthetase GluQRS [Ilumatobacteraceae bacterium]